MRRIVAYVGLFLLAAAALVPFLWLLAGSFKGNMEILTGSPFSLPSALQWGNYGIAWTQGGFREFALNSVLVTLISDAVILLLAAPAAYVLACTAFPGQKLVFALFVVGMVLPPQIALTSLFQLLKSFDILNTRLALILPYIAFFMPLPIFVLRGFFMELPRELSEAAAVDGASSAQTFFHILLPLTRPIVVSLAVLNFVWIWNEFLFALSFIYTNELRTIPAGLFTFVSRQFSNLGAMAAGVVLSILPILVVYFIFQRQIVRGLVAGALK